MGDSSDDSDDWATEDLPDLPLVATKKNQVAVVHQQQHSNDDDNDEGWERKSPPAPAVTTTTNADQPEEDGEPMILVDMTTLSQAADSSCEIHSRFDANAVNDPAAVKALRVRIEAAYETYAKNAEWLADRTVIPCGSTVWRPALAQLRHERPGHYFCPIFPPPKK